MLPEIKRLTDHIVNGRPIAMFERILDRIISENRVGHYKDESYFKKLEELQRERRKRNDITEVRLTTNKIGIIYTVEGYDTVFNRFELDAIGEKFTHLTVY